MAKSTRLVKSFSRLLFPAILLIVAAVVAGAVWLVYTTARPINSGYLVTPDKYGQLSTRAAQVTQETWTNRDGSSAKGWLLKGTENAPAVILLHRFGANRSHVLNLGVKLNESTNFTILMPDMRAHGESPSVENASFGGCEAEDVSAAVEFLRNLKNQNQIAFVGKNIGIYGVEMGASAGLLTAAKDQTIKAIALDSVPESSDGVLKVAIEKRFPFASFATVKLANLGTRLYFFDGCYQRELSCDTARRIENRNVLLLAGIDNQELQESTARMTKCFPVANKIESKLDLSPSGMSIINASMEQSEAYDQRVIDFFRNSLGN